MVHRQGENQCHVNIIPVNKKSAGNIKCYPNAEKLIRINLNTALQYSNNFEDIKIMHNTLKIITRSIADIYAQSHDNLD